MVRTRRAQILMEPGDYEKLEELARRKGLSVAELIRNAVHAHYFLRPTDPSGIVEEISGMNLPLDDWDAIEREIEEGHTDGLS